jgi:predicted acylesterase/phospholipase RssA
LVFPAYRWGWLEQKFDDLYCWPRLDSMTPLARLVRSVKSGAGAVAQWPLQVFAGAGQGYLSVVPTPKGPRLVLRSGHVFALTLAIIAFLTYLIMGANKSRILTTPALVPGLAYVLLFFLVACWALAALSFFLDRYRFPLLLSVVLLASLTGSTPESDHFFRIETEKSVPRLTGQISFTADGVPEYLTPAQYIRERLKDVNHKRLIFVATPGGGIQAAAWTAVVLNGLDKKIQPFRDSVAMISSVSGGSLGAMIYAASFNAPKDKPIPVLENSMRSAIDEVAWGWTTPDFWRTVVPLFRPNLAIDRGWALEQKWAVVNGLSPAPPLFGQVPATNDTYISDWAAQRTKMPALVLNSTMVESGQHVVFSTTQFPAMKNDARGIVNFYSLYAQPGKHFDVRINTAARLSASFPYVAPAARPYGLDNLYEGDFHFVDGGYYDNLGIDSLIGWLTAAYPHVTPVDQPPVDILILQIRHFNAAASAGGSRHGWSFQLIAPPSGFLNMWNTAPVHRDKNELDLFVDNFPSQGGPKITRVTIPYCGLDYKSNESEQAFESCIKDSGGARFHFRPTDESYGRGKLKKNG